jgi:hypothetical protein
VLAQEQAKKDLAAAQLQLPGAREADAKARAADKRAQARLKKLNASLAATEVDLERTRDHLRVVAARAYIHANGGQMAAAISSMLNAKSAVEAASHLHMINEYGNNERSALGEYQDLRTRLDRQQVVIEDLKVRTSARLADARRHLTDVEGTVQGAAKRIADTLVGIAEFQEAATSATSPILGPSRLSANQMADFVMSNGGRPRITVPLVNLAQLFLEEGARTGVRGDVAFAQSILETGSFANPGSRATDNNFSGIGWCDSCAHGYNFADARTGVRAQMQLLRTYVDPNFPEASYTDPILLPGTLSLGFRGRVQTWWDLWGTWATGALYGQRVYDIYERMVMFAATVPPLPPPDVGPPNGEPDDAVSRPPDTGPGTK